MALGSRVAAEPFAHIRSRARRAQSSGLNPNQQTKRPLAAVLFRPPAGTPTGPPPTQRHTDGALLATALITGTCCSGDHIARWISPQEETSRRLRALSECIRFRRAGCADKRPMRSEIGREPAGGKWSREESARNGESSLFGTRSISLNPVRLVTAPLCLHHLALICRERLLDGFR